MANERSENIRAFVICSVAPWQGIVLDGSMTAPLTPSDHSLATPLPTSVISVAPWQGIGLDGSMTAPLTPSDHTLARPRPTSVVKTSGRSSHTCYTMANERSENIRAFVICSVAPWQGIGLDGSMTAPLTPSDHTLARPRPTSVVKTSGCSMTAPLTRSRITHLLHHGQQAPGRRPSSRLERGVTDSCTFGTVASRAVRCGVERNGDLALSRHPRPHLLHHDQRAWGGVRYLFSGTMAKCRTYIMLDLVAYIERNGTCRIEHLVCTSTRTQEFGIYIE
ncbi:hypothetical protein J6590_015602 [Homalodisca vitripennis]|nr:hypothetical protein J6590_015602 [Homalodisca vitripennis]